MYAYVHVSLRLSIIGQNAHSGELDGCIYQFASERLLEIISLHNQFAQSVCIMIDGLYQFAS